MENGVMTNDRSKGLDLFLRKRQAGITWPELYRRGWGNLRFPGTQRFWKIHDTKDIDRHFERVWRQGVAIRTGYFLSLIHI